jgi:hypothetical protein
MPASFVAANKSSVALVLIGSRKAMPAPETAMLPDKSTIHVFNALWFVEVGFIIGCVIRLVGQRKRPHRTVD